MELLIPGNAKQPPSNHRGNNNKQAIGTGRKPRHVVIVAVPPVRTLDIFGPAEVFTDANRLRAGDPVYEVEIVSAVDKRVVTSHIGIPVLTQRTYREVRRRIDTLLVAGGDHPDEMQYSADFLDWLKKQGTKVRRLGSVCTGALVLADAQLLDGRRATTHWNWCNELKTKHPLVEIDPKPIYIKDRNLYTSAGVTAGIDLALALVEDDLGTSLALQIARMMVVFMRRPGGQPQFSETLAAQARTNRPISDLVAWMADNVGGDLSVSALAQRASMSPRNFARVFRQEVGETPARHAERLRVETARRHLEMTSLSLDEVAHAAGFRSAEVLRRTFARHLGVTPGHYRSVFGLLALHP